MRRSILLLAATLAACAGAVDLGQIAWEGTFAGGPGGISGSVATVSVSGRTHASLAIQGAAPGEQYRWRIQQGGCAAEGAVVGAPAIYPVLTADSTGKAGVDVYIGYTLGGSAYAARVAHLETGGAETVLACAQLQLVS